MKMKRKSEDEFEEVQRPGGGRLMQSDVWQELRGCRLW